MSIRQMKDLDKIQERGSLRLTTRQAGTLTFGVLLLVAMAFVVGIQVGRVLSPDEQELVAPDVAAADRTIADILRDYQEDGVPAAPDPGDAQAAAAPGEDPAEADPQTPGEIEPETPEEIEPETPEETEPETPEEVEPETPTPGFQLVWEDEDPTPGPADDDASAGAEPNGDTDPVAGLPAPAREGAFSVQLAAFPTEGEANALLAKLRGAGIEAFKMEAVVKGQTWYRVRVGNFRARADAEAWLGAVRPHTTFDPVVMRD